VPFFHKIHCKYTGVRGFITLYNHYLKYQYMLTEKAKVRARILIFWEKHGTKAALDAFPAKRRTLFNWKARLEKSGGKLESLNDKSKAPKKKRARIWPEEIIAEIKRQRFAHPNLGKDKLFPELLEFCQAHNLDCPKISTIGRIIKDLGGLRMFPQKVSHFGKIKPLKRRKKLRKPKRFQGSLSRPSGGSRYH